MAKYHAFTSPIADGTNTQLVRPGNWNSVHQEYLTISGNTSGASTMSGTNIVLQGGSNVTLSANNNTLVISASNSLHASQIPVFGNYLADADVQHMFNDGFCAGWIKGGEASVTTGSTFTVASGEGFFRTAHSPTARIFYGSWASTTGTMSNNDARYIIADYNAGTPILSLATTQTTSPHMQIYLAELHSPGGSLIAHNDHRPAGDFGRRVIDWASELIGTRIVSGEIVTDPSSPSRKVKITGGSFWDRHFLNYTDSDVDTSVAGTFTTIYRNGSGEWTRTVAQTDWPNTQYDNGSGTLQNMSAGYFANAWVLRSFAGNIYVQYGWAEYADEASAEAEAEPADRPEELHEHGFYAARITFQKSATSPTLILDVRPTIGGGLAASAADGFNILAAGTQTAGTANTVVFSNSNGVTFGMSNNSVITASFAAAGGGAALKGSGTYTQNTGTVEFANSNGITFGLSNNGTMTASHNGLTSQSNQAISGANGSSTFQTITFANSNGLSWSTGTQGFYGSHNGITQQSTQPVAVSGSNGSFAFSTLTFGNLNGLSFYTSNGSIVGSYTDAGAGGGDGYNSAQFTNSTANSTMPILWAGNSNGSGNITMGLTGSTVTASAPSGGGGITYTGWRPDQHLVLVNTAISQGSFWLRPLDLPNITFDRLVFPVSVSGATNSTGTMTVSFGLGVYTRDAQTRLSRLASTTHSFSILHSGTASSANWIGARNWTLPWTTALNASNYWFGIAYSTATGGANFTLSEFRLSVVNVSISGLLGVGSNNTAQEYLGLGRYTAAVTAPPASIAFSEIQGISSAFRRPIPLVFASSTA